MSLSLSNIKWGWVTLGVVIAFIIAYGSTIGVVTIYSGYLAFEARGAPDQAMISAFADQYAVGIQSIFIGIGTLVGGLFAGRKARMAAFQNGVLVGLATAFIDLTFSIFGGFSFWAIVSVTLAVVGGWLGGQLSSQRMSQQVVDL